MKKLQGTYSKTNDQYGTFLTIDDINRQIENLKSNSKRREY
jgi:hypothetical protein